MDAINQQTLDFLLGAEGRLALQRMEEVDLQEAQILPLLSKLRKKYRPDQAGALLALSRLRRRAGAKFPDAQKLYFTQEALEQATNWTIAQHRASWIHRHASPGVILDLGCGIGGDTLALARHRHVIAYELDPTRLRCAQANAHAIGLADRIEFRSTDWTVDLVNGDLPSAAAAFADPARRIDGRRIYKMEQMIPPLSMLMRLQQQIPALGVKIMPGVQDDALPAHCSIEFVSHQGVCKEAVLWFDVLQGQEQRWASIYLQNIWHRLDASGLNPPLGSLSPGQWLHEPDPAVIRAGAFAELCLDLKGHLFDDQLAYIVSSHQCTHPLTQSFVIDEVHPFGLKRLNRRLMDLGIGEVELKKRAAPIEPEQMRHRLKLVPGGQSAVIIFTRKGDERLVLICRRILSGKNQASPGK